MRAEAATGSSITAVARCVQCEVTTTTLSPLPAGLRIHNAVDGSADIVLGRDKRGDRMVPLFRYSTANGVEYAVAISEHDIVRVMNSLVVLFSGDELRRSMVARIDRRRISNFRKRS